MAYCIRGLLGSMTMYMVTHVSKYAMKHYRECPIVNCTIKVRRPSDLNQKISLKDQFLQKLAQKVHLIQFQHEYLPGCHLKVNK